MVWYGTIHHTTSKLRFHISHAMRASRSMSSKRISSLAACACLPIISFALVAPPHNAIGGSRYRDGHHSHAPTAVPLSPPQLLCKSSAVALNDSKRRKHGCVSTALFFSDIQSKWWNKLEVHELPYDSALRALEAYQQVHGDLAIPGSFVVPETNGKSA